MAVDAARAKSLFLAGSDLVDPAERAAYLDRECGGDAELRGRVEALLRANDAAPLSPPVEAGHGTSAYTPKRQPGTEEYGDTTARVGAILAGKYKLVEEIGEGGMGSVYLAQQTEPVKRAVAVKVIKAGMDSKAVLTRFEAERQALAMMDHPNIAKVLDAGTTDGGRPFFVMELVKGTPITQFCDERKLTPRQRLELFVPVCQAIQHAHQKGIIHRDIKPSNVLVALYDDRPVPKVIDFGVAKATGQSLTDQSLLTGFGAIVGTPEYMSPEQASLNNLDIDTRSDVYSLGVLLYELLTGTTPVDRKSLGKAAVMEILRIVREVEAPAPSAKLSTIDTLPSVAANRGTEPARLSKLLKGELDWVLLKALEKDRARRYETANALARDLQRYLADEVVEARPPSAGYRLKKLVKRNKGPVLAASLVLLALLAGMAGTTWGLIRAERSADAERLAKEDADEKRIGAEKAAASEKAAKEQTQKRLAQIEKGVELFAGLLQGINPWAEEQGGEPLYVQLRRRAEQAADGLDAEAVGDPLAVARLQMILGNTLRQLGSAAKAEEVLTKARAIRERELGADHHDTLSTLAYLAQAFQGVGKSPEAITLYEQVRDTLVKQLEADHPDVLSTLHNLADAYRAAGRLPDAIAILEQVRDARVKNLGADHLATVSTLSSLANAYRDVRKLPEAITLYEQVRDARVKKLGADHPDTLSTLTSLASAYQAAGRLPEAVALLEQVREAQVKKLGADHPHTLTTLNNLAEAYWAVGKLPDAIALHEQVRDTRVKKQGADHPATLITLYNLAAAYREARRLPDAIALIEQAATGIAKRQFQHEHAELIIRSTIAIYEEAGQLDKAEGWRRQWLVVVKQQVGAAAPAYAGELASLGLNLLQQRKWSDAENTLRECLAIREKTQPDAWQTFNTQSLLGSALLGQKKYADAGPLLLAGYEGMKARAKTIPKAGEVRVPEALDRLIELYTATNKPDEVKKWQAERAKYPRADPPREEPK